MTALTRAKAALHPNRVLLLDLVRRNPGINARQAIGQSQLGRGTAQHHLRILLRLGLLVGRRRGLFLHLFADESADEGWIETALRRKPNLAVLLDWLKAHPGSTQSHVLDAMQAQGWNRSTTQYRLYRLVAAGVAQMSQQGRYKLYSSHSRIVTAEASSP